MPAAAAVVTMTVNGKRFLDTCCLIRTIFKTEIIKMFKNSIEKIYKDKLIHKS